MNARKFRRLLLTILYLSNCRRSNQVNAAATRRKPVEGALPNAENAIIDPNKIYNHALNPDNAEGGPKSKVFQSTFGFNRSNGEQLIAQILGQVNLYEHFNNMFNKYVETTETHPGMTWTNYGQSKEGVFNITTRFFSIRARGTVGGFTRRWLACKHEGSHS